MQNLKKQFIRMHNKKPNKNYPFTSIKIKFKY